MLLIPAIDIKDGKCVRLCQGQMNRETIYADNPVEMADHWIEAGARNLHLIDLDGAVKGYPYNEDIICTIATRHPDILIQVGGGIRDKESIQNYLNTGVDYVIIGTRAVSTPHFVAKACLEFPGHIIVSLDSKNGKLATDGWSKLAHHDTVDLARQFEDDGVEAIIFTDISRDGMLNKINIEATVAFCKDLTIPVFAAGGFSDIDDVKALCEVASQGIKGAIIGRALYEGTLDLTEGQRLADRLCPTEK